MTKEEAEREASARNLELGDRRRPGFWIEVERSDGSWDIEFHDKSDRRSKRERLVDGVVELLAWLPFP